MSGDIDDKAGFEAVILVSGKQGKGKSAFARSLAKHLGGSRRVRVYSTNDDKSLRSVEAALLTVGTWNTEGDQ